MVNVSGAAPQNAKTTILVICYCPVHRYIIFGVARSCSVERSSLGKFDCDLSEDCAPSASQNVSVDLNSTICGFFKLASDDGEEFKSAVRGWCLSACSSKPKGSHLEV